VAAAALADADVVSLPACSSFSVEAVLFFSLSPALPPSSSPSSAQLPQPAAATVAACLLHLLSISTVFLPFSSLLSSLLSSGL